MLEEIIFNKGITSDNVGQREIAVPESNIRQPSLPIMPERFTSTTKPYEGSIMPPGYNSVTEPRYHGRN